MALRLEDKKAIVADVAAVAQKAVTAVAADYRGLTVSQMTELRSKARDAGVYVRIVRNTLARRAIEGTHFECMKESLTGPLILAFSEEEPSAPARLFRDFAKSNEAFEVKHVSIDGQLLDATQLDKVASLPTYDEAIALLMNVMQAPVTKFVRTTAETYSQMVRVFGAVRDQKQTA